MDGSELGFTDGFSVGPCVGVALCNEDGSILGTMDGSGLGSTVGYGVGT